MAAEGLPDFVAMTMEEMDEWIASEEAKTPFTSFDLNTDEGRQGLLRKYYMIGDTSLFEAVSHIWASLNEPKAVYGTGIGIAAGTGGTGKRGIVLALQQFLAKALAGITWIPAVKDFANMGEWHEASMRTFEDDEEHLCALLTSYSVVLNGGAVAEKSGSFEATVVQGPWTPMA